MNERTIDSLRKVFSEISQERIDVFEKHQFKIDFDNDLNFQLSGYLGRLCDAIEKLDAAGAEDFAAQSALLVVRAHAMTLSSFFDGIVDDSEFLLKHGKWQKIPDDYVAE